MKKTLVVGNSSFVTLIEDENYYVDKTAFIKAVMESGHFVDLITRPRRFGKTLFMDTLNAFLTMNPETSGGKTRQQASLLYTCPIPRYYAACRMGASA